MQDFHYNYIKNKYEMLLADTDSLLYKIETENVYEDLYKYKKLFDFSDYPKYSKYYYGENNLVAYKRFCRIKI